MPVSPRARMALAFLAALTAALAAAPPVDIPGWAAALIAAAAAGFAAIGLVPPGWTLNGDKTRAFRGPARAKDASPGSVDYPRRKHQTRRTSLIVAGLSALMLALGASPASAAYVHLANCRAALTGANGDHDINRFIASNMPMGITGWTWGGGYHRSNTDVLVAVDLWRYGYWIGAATGECWGDDSNISDNIKGP